LFIFYVKSPPSTSAKLEFAAGFGALATTPLDIEAFASAVFLIASDDASPPTTVFTGVVFAVVVVDVFVNAAKILDEVLGPYIPSGVNPD
jgi:hypothetical protein